MPADVNVTEKVARAKAASHDRPVYTIDYDDARTMLSALADPEVQAGIAGVLREHGWVYTQPATATRCVCGKRWAATSYDVDSDMAAHQAAAVVEWLRGRA